MLTLTDHRLHADAGSTPVAFAQSPNHNGAIKPKLLIFHYTACSFAAARAAFLRATGDKRVSAHLLVDIDGSVTQFVPFDRRAWHAGESTWGELSDINTHSIGIEVVNYGYLLKTAAGGFQLGDGTPAPFGADGIVEARHKNPKLPYRFWQAYTPAQIDTCTQLAELLVGGYGLRDVLGHDDIAPNRKQDPGPAFPLASIRGKAVGRDAQEVAAVVEAVRYVAVSRLNIRTGPDASAPLAGEPLHLQTRLDVLARSGRWLKVRAEAAVPLGGWVAAEFTRT